MALLIAPLAAVAMFGTREIARNNDLASSTTSLANAVELSAAAATLRAPLQVERLAAVGLTSLDEVDPAADPDAAAFSSSVDPAALDFVRVENRAALEKGRARVLAAMTSQDVISQVWRDEFVAASGALDGTLARIGEPDAPGVPELVSAFERVDVALDSLTWASETEAATLAPPSQREAAVIANVAAISDMSTSAADEMRTITDAVFDVSTPDMTDMVGSNLRHADALAAMGTIDPDGAASLQRSYDELTPLDAAFGAAAASSVASGEVTADELIDERVDYLDEVASFAFDETAAAVEVVEERSALAASDNRQTIMTFAAVGLASLLFGIIVIRSFARPLNKLRLQAERIGRGELSADPLELDGPSDVRKVTGAINDMASTLAMVEVQMQALALSDLDGGPELDELPGKVGASMRNSMERVHALTTRLKASEARLAEEARIDNLTGLPNRFAVLEHLGRLVEALDAGLALDATNGESWPPPGSTPPDSTTPAVTLGIMFLDVDGFKSVNDTHGHAVGDVVLREIAQRLRRSVREVDFVARLGGDEFLVVVGGVRDGRVLQSFGERLISEIEQPYVVGDQLFAVSASIGATLIERGDDALSAIQRADAAVYQAKRRGRRRVEMFDHELQASIEHQAELELALRQAIQHDELRIHLQPLADLSTGMTAGAEVLVRWERPGVGLVPPNDFIPIAERSGLIFDLERWVLDAACKRAAEWQLRGVGSGMRLAINISGRHLIEGDLLSALDDAIEATGVDPTLLEIELTESHLLDDVNRAQVVLAGVRERGIKVAIDDFGTGYSSMTYLQKLPVDIVKIDRSFVNSATSNDFDSTVIESVVTISRALSLEIVAEGIETSEQLDYVIRAGCTYGQGYFLARPVPVDEAESIMFGGPMFRTDAAVAAAWSDRPPSGQPIDVDLAVD